MIWRHPMDYRTSHLKKGDIYDSELTQDPLSVYLARWEKQYLADILPSLFSEGNGRYLDFACGTGRITQMVTPFAKDSYGVDISESMLKIARKKCSQVQFICTDITVHALDIGLCDLITSFRFFGNAQKELRFAALQAINRCLRLGGYLVINNHRNPLSLINLAQKSVGIEHGMDLTHFKLRNLLHECGFEIKTSRAIGFHIYRAKLIPTKEIDYFFTKLKERAFRSAAFVPLAPDAIIVAQKVSERALSASTVFRGCSQTTIYAGGQ